MNNSQQIQGRVIQLKKTKKVRELSKGGAGQVSLIKYQQKESGETHYFAKKKVHIKTKHQRMQIIKQIGSLRKIQSPYITQFYQCCTQNDTVNFIMQYMDLGDLNRLLQHIRFGSIRLTQQQLSTIIRYILEGLSYIHDSVKLIHRDIKPQNILLNSNGQIKICDFGISKLLKDISSCQTNHVGTEAYKSPERFLKNSIYDQKIDIWAMGLILYQLSTGDKNPCKQLSNLTKKTIFFQKDPSIQIQNFKNRQFKSEPKFLSQQLCEFLIICLRRDPQNRMSASELLKHLWIRKYENENLYHFIQRYKQIQK